MTDAPRRVTDLAELEGLAQPTMTLLVQRLEQRRWVERSRDPDDGRVVLVSLADATLEEYARRFSSSKPRPRRSAHSSTRFNAA